MSPFWLPHLRSGMQSSNRSWCLGLEFDQVGIIQLLIPTQGQEVGDATRPCHREQVENNHYSTVCTHTLPPCAHTLPPCARDIYKEALSPQLVHSITHRYLKTARALWACRSRPPPAASLRRRTPRCWSPSVCGVWGHHNSMRQILRHYSLGGQTRSCSLSVNVNNKHISVTSYRY